MTDEKYRRPADAASRLAELREGGKKAAEIPLVEADEVSEETGESFSTLSADRHQKVMLELRQKTGDSTALAYSYLVRARFNPSNGIHLDFSVVEVQITGRNLRPLFAGIVAQRVAVVNEVDELQAEALAPKEGTVVTRIEVQKKGDSE